MGSLSPCCNARQMSGSDTPRSIEHLAGRIRELEERLLDPVVRRSAEAAPALLDDEFVEVGSSGRVYSKSRVLAALAEEAASGRETRFRLTDFSLRVLGPEAVLARYRVEGEGLSGSEPRHSLRSSVWVLQSGRWQLLFHQGTPTSAAAREKG